MKEWEHKSDESKFENPQRTISELRSKLRSEERQKWISVGMAIALAFPAIDDIRTRLDNFKLSKENARVKRENYDAGTRNVQAISDSHFQRYQAEIANNVRRLKEEEVKELLEKLKEHTGDFEKFKELLKESLLEKGLTEEEIDILIADLEIMATSGND